MSEFVFLAIYVVGGVIAAPIFAADLRNSWAKEHYHPGSIMMAVGGMMCVVMAAIWPLISLGFVVFRVGARRAQDQ